MAKPFLDLTGHIYNYLTVIRDLGVRNTTGKNIKYWLCQCKCGNTTEASSGNLRSNQVMSCGCRTVEKATKHGGYKDPLYGVHTCMIQRCTNPNYRGYENYGARGITFPDEWRDYVEFKKWALNSGYKKGLSIDRIRTLEGYSPNNCRWATRTTQSRNKRKKENTSSEYIGVSWSKERRKWIAKITIHRKDKNLGGYPTEILAAQARDNYIIENQLEHFVLNFP